MVDMTYPVARAIAAAVEAVNDEGGRLYHAPGFLTTKTGDVRYLHIFPRHRSAWGLDVAMVHEFGCYTRQWGPMVQKAARSYWTSLKNDLALLGATVNIPDDSRFSELYWATMPGGMPRVARDSTVARRAHLAELEATWNGPVQLAAPYAPARNPLEEERAASRAAWEATQLAAAATPPSDAQPALATVDPVAERPLAWEFGHWGKGCVSASGQLYTWNTTHPNKGGRPQHAHGERLIDHFETADVVAAGREVTGVADVGYLTPIVIAPDGRYVQLSSDPFWSITATFMGDVVERRTALLQRFPSGVFSDAVPALREEQSVEAWQDRALGSSTYGHADVLSAP